MFEIFPNPESGSFTLRFIAIKNENINIQLRSVRGEVVLRMKNQQTAKGLNDFVVNAKGLPTGVYYVLVSVDSQARAVEKIVIINN